MRKRMGGLLLAAGVGGLGLWGNFNQAESMETAIAEAAAAVASNTAPGVETRVDGRDIVVSGLVNDTAERDAVLAAMDSVEGRRVVVDNLTIIPKVSPFTFERVKTTNGSDYAGFVPSEAVRSQLAPALGATAAARLTLSSGAPEAWAEAIIAGNAGLEELKSGTLTLSDQTVTLAGLAATPVEKEAALAAIKLPDGYALISEIDVEDDGKPFALKVVFDGSKTTIEGKLPAGSDIANMASGRGLGAVTTDVAVAQIKDTTDLWPDFAQTGLAALGRLSEGTLEMEGKRMLLSGVGTPSGKSDAEYLLGALPASLDVIGDITVFDDGEPILVKATKQVGTGIVATEGKLPFDYNIRAARITDPEILRTGFLQDPTGRFDGNLKAASGALLLLREGTLEASADLVRVTGVASSIAAANSVERFLNERVKGELIAEITVFDDGVAIGLGVTKSSDGTLTASSGKLPFGVTENSYGLAPSVDVSQAAIVDETGRFDPNVKAGLAALEPLSEGVLEVSVDRVKITGTAATREQEQDAISALDNLSSAVRRDVNVTVLDAETQPTYSITFDAATGASLDGMMPAGVSVGDVEGLLNVPVDGASAEQAATGDGTEDKLAIAEFAEWLPELDKGRLEIKGDAVLIDAVVSPGADLDLVRKGMANSMGPGTQIKLSELDILPALGSRRTNVVSKQDEQFISLSWLPVATFDPSPSNCNTQTETAMQDAELKFVSGSSTLDAKSHRAINQIGAIVRRCIVDGQLQAEIQGHTDARGSNAANNTLSQARANAVTEALIARGVPARGMTAVGYGETQPIADNATAEGRAQNRRIAIVWSQ